MNQDLSGKPLKPLGEKIAEWDRIAAGKETCGTCHWKDRGAWVCQRGQECPTPLASNNFFKIHGCKGWQKDLRKVRPSQPKKKGLPVPPGVKFLYIGVPRGKTKKGVPQHRGVVTVVWIESSPGTLVMGFSFCSPEDPWCKITGRKIAMTRLYEHPLVQDGTRSHIVAPGVRAANRSKSWDRTARVTS